MKIFKSIYYEFEKGFKENAYRARQKRIDDILKSLLLGKDAKLLGVGCAEGRATLQHAEVVGIKKENIYGLDIDDRYIKLAKEKFKVYKTDVEVENFLFEDCYFDLVIADQILEHIKNIKHVIDEVFRVLKPGGYFIVSTPNLAALHNRTLLFFGKQPLCINVFSDHIRGFVPETLKKFILKEVKGSKVIYFTGAGFYPLWGWLAEVLSKIFPTLAVYIIFLFRK